MSLASTSDFSGSSNLAATFLLSNTAIGIGLLAFPYGYFLAGGFLVSIIIQVIFFFLSILTMVIIGYYRNKCNANSYEVIVEKMCGKLAKRVVTTLLTISLFGSCITFLIAIGDQFEQVTNYALLKTNTPERPWFLDRRVTMTLFSFLIILPLSLLKNITFLKYSSYIGIISVVYVVSYVTIGYFKLDLPKPNYKTISNDFKGILRLILTILFGYQAHVSVVPIHCSMRNRMSLKAFTSTVTMSMSACFFLYSTVGTFGYFSFGDKVNPNIILNYKPNVPMIICNAFLGVKLLASYPILSFCGRLCVFSLIREACGEEKFNKLKDIPVFSYIISICWFLATFVLAITTPDISYAISALGGISAIYSYVGPGLLILIDQYGIWSRHVRLPKTSPKGIKPVIEKLPEEFETCRALGLALYSKAVGGFLLMTFGIFAFLLSTYLTIESIILNHQN